MAGNDGRIGYLRVLVTVVIALIVAILPLPRALDIARPELLLLLVIYWSLSAPRIAGLAFAWICGLMIDLLKGTTLGQYGLAFLLVAFLTHRLQLRMRNFPIWHQTLTVFMFLAFYEFVVFWTDGIIGTPITTWTRWLPVLTSAIVWPVVVTVLNAWNRRNR